MADIQRALVTGANGFIAGALTLRLIEQGVAVRAVCRDPERGRYLTGAEVVQGDVQDADGMRRHAEDCDVVFHLAAVGNGSAQTHYRVNVQGSENVAQAAHEAGAARLVHISSVAVYGLQIAGSIFESHPYTPSPRDYYQQTKAEGEKAVWGIAQRTGLTTTVIRPAYVYGPRSPFWSIRLFKWCQQWPFVPDFGVGTAHPIYIDDLVEMIIVAATDLAAPGEAFNASADPAVTWNEFLGYYARMAGNKRKQRIPTGILAPFARPIDEVLRLRGQSADISGTLRMLSRQAVYRMDKASERLGWQPRISLSEGMARTEQWLMTTQRGNQ